MKTQENKQFQGAANINTVKHKNKWWKVYVLIFQHLYLCFTVFKKRKFWTRTRLSKRRYRGQRRYIGGFPVTGILEGVVEGGSIIFCDNPCNVFLYEYIQIFVRIVFYMNVFGYLFVSFFIQIYSREKSNICANRSKR